MREQKYENFKIDDLSHFSLHLTKIFGGIGAVEYDRETQELILHYEDAATILTEAQLKNIKIPTILKFRKTLPTTDIPNAKFTSENEFIVETFDVKATRKKVKEKHPHFKEVK